jgi:hypothetical protein
VVTSPDKELPPVMPKQVLELRLRDFAELVLLHRLRLAGSDIGQPEIRSLEREFRALKAAYYASDPELEGAIKGIDEDKSTNLTDFSLESKLHASQFFDLQAMKLE